MTPPASPPEPAREAVRSRDDIARAPVVALTLRDRATRFVRELIPASLRWRLIGALLLAVVLAVVAETVSHMAEESARLERELAAQGDRVSDTLRAELEQTVNALDFEIEGAGDPRTPVSRTISSLRVEARVLGTKARLQEGVLEVLKALGPDGAILSSGHWPASFGALDPNYQLYKSTPGRSLHIVDEPTPQGSAPALERWSPGRSGAREIIVVAGRFLDAPALERMRTRTAADVVALCRAEPAKLSLPPSSPPSSPSFSPGSPGSPGSPDARSSSRGIPGSPRCVATGFLTDPDSDGTSPGRVATDSFDPDDDDVSDRLHLAAIDLGTHHLWVGLDRSSILRVRAGILRRAVAVGLASIAFAMLLGTVLATRLTRPIEELAQAAGTLASGDLKTRVRADGEGRGEVHHLVAAFNQMAADLEKNQTKLLQAERVAAWQEIARGLAHELKNPLTPILGAMDVVRKARKLDRPDFDAILEEQATAVVEEVMRLKELSDAFARFARLPDRKPEPLKMNDLVDHAAALYGNDEGVTIVRVYDAALPIIEADKTQVGTVVTNLVKNAVEAMDRKGTLSLTLRHVNGVNDVVELVVEDSGPGIAPEIADRLFTPYVTTKGSRGTGLGLALAHRIVAEHGGTIEAARSTKHGGAAFTVRLPVKSAPLVNA
jgi:signal transduction histidine kinase